VNIRVRETSARIAAILLRGVLSWLLLWTFVFLLLRLLAPDPVTVIAGLYTDPATRARLGAEFGVGLPGWRTYLETLERTLTLDFGLSWRTRLPVPELLRQPLLLSLAISGAGTVTACFAAVVAFLMAAGRGHARIGWLRVAATGMSAVPGFLVALIVSRSRLPLRLGLPAYGMLPGAAGRLSSIVIPTLCVILPVLPYSVLRMLVCHQEIVNAPWFRTARAFGGSRLGVTLRQGWPFVVAVLADVAANATVLNLTSAVAVEFVFGLPGLGTAMIDAIQLRDTPVILAIVSAVSLLTILLFGLRDISQAALRVRNG
jgi:peptide/nickel transport system permease protein